MLSMRACFEKSLPCLHRRDVPTFAETAAPPTQPAAALPSAAELGVSEEKLKRS